MVDRCVDVDDLPLERATKAVDDAVRYDHHPVRYVDAAVRLVDVATPPLDSPVRSLDVANAPRGSPSKSLDLAEKSVESPKSVDVAVRTVSIAHRPVEHPSQAYIPPGLSEGQEALSLGDPMRARAAAHRVLVRAPDSPIGLALLADACEAANLVRRSTINGTSRTKAANQRSVASLASRLPSRSRLHDLLAGGRPQCPP